jgi:hypothetical protein
VSEEEAEEAKDKFMAVQMAYGFTSPTHPGITIPPRPPSIASSLLFPPSQVSEEEAEEAKEKFMAV